MFLYKRGMQMTDEVALKPSMYEKLQDKIFCYMSMALLVLLPVIEVVFEFLRKFKVGSFKRFTPSKYQAHIIKYFAIVLTVFIIITFVMRIIKGFKLYVADIFYVTLTVFMILSMIFSVNRGVFAGGSEYYCEWPTHFLCYYGLFYAGSMIKDPQLRKRLMYSLVFVALLEGVIAYFQTFDWEITYCLFRDDRVSKTTYGTCQNTNFYGTLSTVLTAVTAGLFIFSKKLFKSQVFKWIIYAVSLLVFYTLLASQARLAWLGVIGLVFTYVVSLLVMRKKSNIDKETFRDITNGCLVIAIGYLMVMIITVMCTPYIVSRVEYTASNDVTDLLTGDEGFGSGRGWIWKVALYATKNHPLTGIGLDNLGQAFREMPTYIEGVSRVQDKGHNEYIHTLATQGIPALINYLALLVYSVTGAVKAIINEKDEEKRSILWICLGVVAAYLAQALLSSSVMNVAIYFWIFLGLITPRTKAVSFKKR